MHLISLLDFHFLNEVYNLSIFFIIKYIISILYIIGVTLTYKYYFCDATYTNTREFMTPYRNMRYWLARFRLRQTLTKEERFNHAHTQLSNVFERAYGILKGRCSITKQMVPYPFAVQRNIIITYFAVHNFIRN